MCKNVHSQNSFQVPVYEKHLFKRLKYLWVWFFFSFCKGTLMSFFGASFWTWGFVLPLTVFSVTQFQRSHIFMLIIYQLGSNVWKSTSLLLVITLKMQLLPWASQWLPDLCSVLQEIILKLMWLACDNECSVWKCLSKLLLLLAFR